MPTESPEALPTTLFFSYSRRRMRCTLSLFQEHVHIPGKEVDLDIYAIPLRKCPEVRVCERIGDERDGKPCSGLCRYGKSDSVDRYRALRSDESHERSRDSDTEHAFFRLLHAAACIHVTRDKVPVDSVAECERPLNIDLRAARERARSR